MKKKRKRKRNNKRTNIYKHNNKKLIRIFPNEFEAKNQMSRKNNILRVVKTNILEKNINEN